MKPRTPSRAAVILVGVAFGATTSSEARAQTATYLQQSRTAAYQSLEDRGLSTTTQSTSLTEVSINLPFDFDYLGRDFDRVFANAAGHIRFVTSGSPGFNRPFNSFNDGIPNTLSPNQMIAPFWTNNLRGKSPSDAATIVTATEGSAPNRIFYIEYQGVEVASPTDTTREADFLIALEEGTGTFEVSYGGELSSPSFGGTIGVAGYEGTGSASDEFGFFAGCTENGNCTESEYNGSLSGRVFTVSRVDEPELAFVELEVAPGARPGETVTATLTVQNLGLDTAVGVDVSFFLSTDAVVSGSDIAAAELDDAFDAPNGVSTHQVQFTLPGDVLLDRRYHLYAQLDPDDEFVELIEDDDLLITSEPNFGTGFDVEVTECRVTTPASMVFAGAEVTFEVTIENRGVPYRSPLEIALWASSDDRFDTIEDISLGTPRSGPLPGRREVVVAVRGTLPADELSPGTYFPICIADPNNEFDELGAADGNTFVGRPQDRFAISIPPLRIVEAMLPTAVVGQPYEFEIGVTGGTFDDRSELGFMATGLPNGLELTSTGILRGTPVRATDPEGVEVEVTVNDDGAFDRAFFTLIVEAAPPVMLTDTNLPAGALGAEYDAQLSASGGVGAITFLLSGGELPPGLILASDGAISGTPTQGGGYTFTVTARDTPPTGGTASQDSREFSIDVAGGAFVVDTASLPAGTVGEMYAATIETSGAVLPVTWMIEMGDRLPDGLESEPSSDTSALLITGTPSRDDDQSFDVIATDAIGRIVDVRFSIAIEPAAAPTCPGDPSCPEDPGPIDSVDESSGCTTASPVSLAPWLLLPALVALVRRPQRQHARASR